MTMLSKMDRLGLECGPDDEVSRPSANASLSSAPLSSSPSGPQRQADILIETTPQWRQDCLDAVGNIPAGYTYLAQLMGHDLGSSITLNELPYTVQRCDRSGLEDDGSIGKLSPRPVRYNLIENPLTLETVYGPGPRMLSHLFDPKTRLFRIPKGALVTTLYKLPGESSFRALYDERNRDTLMLHELTAAWMQFHNLCVSKLPDRDTNPMGAYAQARAHAVRVWHGIIRDDLLPKFLHSGVTALRDDELDPLWALGEANLLHGLFRAFHALPRSTYLLGDSGERSIGSLMRKGFKPSEAELARWEVDWEMFLDDPPIGSRTGISASVEPDLKLPDNLARMDLTTAGQVKVPKVGAFALSKLIKAMKPAAWSDQLDPETLGNAFAAKFRDAPGGNPKVALKNAPLHLLLMIEAQVHGESGSFGPFGSVLLRKSILESIEAVKVPDPMAGAPDLPFPKTMMQLIQDAREE